MSLFRIWAKLAQRRSRRGFHSRYGGLWTDKREASAEVGSRLSVMESRPEAEAALQHWIERGFWIARSALPSDQVDQLNREIDALWSSTDEGMFVEIGGEVSHYRQDLRSDHCKLVDLYARSRTALDVALNARIQWFLRLIFDDAPILFQSLSFERGSEQPGHQDTAYVVVTPPLEFAAAWIALEDVQPGSGELFYYPGSHRIEDYTFRGGYRNWSRERDGLEAQHRYHAWLLEQMESRGFERETFCPRKGDVLFWNADLVHGGSLIRDRALSRKSFVCHYCPARARPYYFTYLSNRRVLGMHPSGAQWASSHYHIGSSLGQR